MVTRFIVVIISVYTNIKSLCCTHETMLHVNYTLILKKNHEAAYTSKVLSTLNLIPNYILSNRHNIWLAQSACKETNDHEKCNTLCSDLSLVCVHQNPSGFNVPSTNNWKQTQTGTLLICQKGVYPTFIPIFVQSPTHTTNIHHRTWHREA